MRASRHAHTQTPVDVELASVQHGSAFGCLDRTQSEEVEQLKKKGGQAWFGGWSGKQTELTKVRTSCAVSLEARVARSDPETVQVLLAKCSRLMMNR